MARIIERDGYKIILRRGETPRLPAMREANRNGGGGALAISSTGLYATPLNTGQSDYYRPRPWRVGSGQIISDYDWADLLSYSQQLFAQLGNLAWAILQKGYYAVGDAWRPQFMGTEKAWGEEATMWLQEVWYPQCDIRGGVFDFTTNLFLSSVAWDVDGDDCMVLALDEADFPKLKFVSASRIGTKSGPVKGGPLNGATMRNGIIFDRQGRFLGVNILDGDKETAVPAYSADLRFEPEWRDVTRGIPRVGRTILDWFDIQDIDIFLKRGVKLESSIGLMHTTVGGEAPPGGELGSGNIILDSTGREDGTGQSAPTEVKIERRMGGEVYYMQAGMDEKLEGFTGQRPHPNTEAFITRLERRGLCAVGWFIELLDPSKIGGASVRMIQDEARHSVHARQRNLGKRACRAVQFAVAQAMRTGRISTNRAAGPGGMPDFMRWGFNMPAQLTVDAGYDEQADRDNLLIGSTTLAAVCEKKGRFWRDTRTARLEENKNLMDCAIELMKYAQAEGQELSFAEAMRMMQAAAGQPAPAAAAAETNTDTATVEDQSKEEAMPMPTPAPGKGTRPTGGKKK